MEEQEKGIMELRDVHDLVKKIQLQNIVAHKKREVILCSQELLSQGMGENVLPTEVMIGVIEMKSGENIFALIVNDFVLTSLNDAYMVEVDDDSDDLVIVGNEIVNKRDFPYEECDITNQN
jgi:hypothetical protein